MEKLQRDLLWSLEAYSELRPQFRAQVIAHKRQRRVAIGTHAALYFEDFLTMKYQVQEMLRTERIFEAAAIAEELDAYNPLIPDGANLKATFMIEYADAAQRQDALPRLTGIEDTVWLQAGDAARTFAIANEDMARSTQDKTAAVHFLRLELDAEAVTAMKSQQQVVVGIDHPALTVSVTLTAQQQASLAADLD